jgi:hypothetical protein
VYREASVFANGSNEVQDRLQLVPDLVTHSHVLRRDGPFNPGLELAERVLEVLADLCVHLRTQKCSDFVDIDSEDW